MKVVLSDRALGELREIGLYVAQDDHAAAERLVLSLHAKALDLRDAPERGQIIGSRRGVEVRKLVHGRYLIVYSVSADAVRVHRIVHGARSPRLLLKGVDLL